MRGFTVALTACLCCWGLQAPAQDTPPPALPALDAVWIAPQFSEPGNHVSLDVVLQASYNVSQPLVFPCAIECRSFHGASRLTLELRDAADRLVREASLKTDLYRGHNECTIKLDAADLPPGEYTARFAVNYAVDFPPATLTASLSRVNTGDFESLLSVLTPQIATLDQRIAAMKAEGRALPYQELQMQMAARAVATAREEAKLGRWRDVAARIQYLNQVIHRAYAGLVLTGHFPELSFDATPPALAQIALREGLVYGGASPAYLFGLRLSTPDTARLEAIAPLGLNTVVLAIPPAQVFPSTSAPLSLAGQYDAFFDAAERLNVTVLVELDVLNLPGWFMDAHPDVLAGGSVDLAHPEMRTLYEQHCAAVLPYVASKQMAHGVSLFNEPRFHFDGEQTRQRFIEHVQMLYPDRLDLTRAWRAHLGKFDDIQIWDDSHPWYASRPFQFDWQDFHKSLGTQYFTWARDVAQPHAGKLNLFVTLPDAAFLEGESRSGVDREALAGMMDLQACMANTLSRDPIFAMSFPSPAATFALHRSMQPGKPVYNLSDRLEIADGQSTEQIYHFARAAMWEAVMNGLNADILAEDSPVWERPEALEGYATAALDINRLAELVAAFQRAPTDVGILFSASSKILDDGTPHLATAKRAFEGASFGGYHVRFLTESQVTAGAFDEIKMLAIPLTPSLTDAAFERVAGYVEQGGPVARPGDPIPYNERGQSRGDVVRPTGRTVLMRDAGLATEYLHAMDAANDWGALPSIPRPVNAFGYPLEGVRTRYVLHNGEPYLYMVNLRREPVQVFLAGNRQTGRDLIGGRDIEFPRDVPSLQTMLIRLDTAPFIAEATLPVPVESLSRAERRQLRREQRREAGNEIAH